ncbi:hypothetical protein CJ030_MR3G017049 [Morella rubra]|uniref:Fungal lipase-type domain-containing protein n=1 Tax=Morella rubra TaxID=262757 RepID=A0A6A1W509_9ROSI|nr:hypothetical protein CJ030_MR3G017049 [Morella rubra]
MALNSANQMLHKPENASFSDLVRFLLSPKASETTKFIENSEAEAFGGFWRRWYIFISLLVQKHLIKWGKLMSQFGYMLELWLNLLSSNGGSLRMVVNFLTDESIGQGNKEYNTTLSVMACKLAYENEAFIQAIVEDHWNMKFVKYYNCWNDYQEKFSTQAIMFQNTKDNPNLIVVAFKGTDPFNPVAWQADFDLSWVEFADVGKLHSGFCKALGMQKEYNGFPKEIEQGSDQRQFAYYAIRERLRDIMQKNENAKFAVTGHSLGGALAVLFLTVLALAFVLVYISCKSFYGEMKHGREFPSVTSGQLHSMSSIPSPTLSAPSPRVNEGMSQGTPACPSSCASTSASKRGRGRTRGVSLEKSLGSGSGSAKLSVHIPEGECGGVSSTAATLSTKIEMLDHFDLDYTRHEDVRTVVETMMTARRTHRNRMHAYFKKFPSKEAALLKPHPDTTEEQWKELCDLFTSEAFMKNQESGNINPAELYKKNYTNKDGIWTSEGAREIYERMDAFQRQCDLEGKTYTEIEVYSEILGKKSGYVRGLGRAHQLAKARDEIEAMRAAREKDLQEFAKKQAEMEATLRDHREEQRVEQERIRLEQEERMKREQERMRIEHESACNKNKSACERSKSAYGQKYRRNWRRKCPL